MEKILGFVKKASKFAMIGAMLTAATFALLFHAGNFGGGFMPGLGTLLALVIEVSLWAAMPVLTLIKKKSLAKKLFIPISAYWYLTFVFNALDNMGFATGNDGVRIAYGVFCFFIALAVIGAFALYIVGVVMKKPLFKIIGFLTFAGTFLFFLIAFALLCAIAARGNAGWNAYFYAMLTYFALPAGMFFAALYFYGDDEVVLGKKESEPVAEEKTEEEAPAEEVSAEKPVEEEKEEAAATEEPATEEPVAEATAEEAPVEEAPVEVSATEDAQ